MKLKLHPDAINNFNKKADNLLSEKTSRCVVFGKENFESTKHLVLENGNLVQISEAIIDKNIQPWV